MKAKSLDPVTDQLDALGCSPLPAAVRAVIDQEVDDDIAVARAKIIRKKVTVEAVARAFRHAFDASADRPELSRMPPPLPEKEEALA